MQPADRVAHLLDELCVRLGICLPPAARRRLEADALAPPDAFAAAVFRAEGLDPVANRRLYGQVRAAVDRALSSDAPRDA